MIRQSVDYKQIRTAHCYWNTVKRYMALFTERRGLSRRTSCKWVSLHLVRIFCLWKFLPLTPGINLTDVSFFHQYYKLFIQFIFEGLINLRHYGSLLQSGCGQATVKRDIRAVMAVTWDAPYRSLLLLVTGPIAIPTHHHYSISIGWAYGPYWSAEHYGTTHMSITSMSFAQVVLRDAP